MINLVLLGIGISTGVYVVTYYCFKYINILWQKPQSYKYRLSTLLEDAYSKKTTKNEKSLITLYGALAGLFIGLLLTIKTQFIVQGTIASICLGYIISLVVKKGIEDVSRMRKLKELALIYEASVYYTSAGYTLRQSLEKSRDLVDLLRPALDRCLAVWPYGAIRAIYSFGEEVDLPEAGVMAGIFAHVEEKGSDFNEAAIIEQIQSLESLRKTLAEIKILSKPLYFAVYRALPLFAICGIIVGSLLNRVIIMLSSLMNL